MNERSIHHLLIGAQFLTSAAKVTQCPTDQGYEIAFAGRSNAGKSSAINRLTQQRQLARSSKTPGRTQLLNFFTLDEERRLVDLPGYGYAAVSQQLQAAWKRELAAYLSTRQCLRGLILLMDIRHPDKELDRMLLDWAGERGLPVHILLTKCDKLNRGPALQALARTHQALATRPGQISLQLFSSSTGVGIEECEARLTHWLELATPLSDG